MKKHKQHLIDHNTLESTAPKVDSSTAAMDRHATASAVSRDDKAQQSLRGSEATEAIHNEKADSSAKVDRHADKSARDDRENADSSNAQNLNNSQAAKTTPTTKPPQDSNPTPSTQDSTTQLARDDRENADSSNAQNLNNSQAAKTTPTTKPPQDSNPTPSTQDSTTQLTKAVTPTLTPSQQDSRIFALESRALQGERGDKTNGLSHKRAEAIHDSGFLR